MAPGMVDDTCVDAGKALGTSGHLNAKSSSTQPRLGSFNTTAGPTPRTRASES